MPLQTVDWASFLKDDSTLPTDISFKVYKNGSVLAPVSDKLDSEPFRIFRAHKFLLAVESPMFRQQFLGSLSEITDPVLVVLTSSKAFGILLDFIYLTAQDFLFPCDHFSCLFEVRNLGGRYLMTDLINKTELEISNRQLSSENLIEAAQSAKNYHQFFPEISEELMMRCNVFFTENYQTREDIRKFLNDHEESEIKTDIIMMLIKWKPAHCDNCKQIASECLNGNHVTRHHDIAIGTKVRRAWDEKETGIIIQIKNLENKYASACVRFPICGDIEDDDCPHYLLIDSNDFRMLRFGCH